MIFACLVLQTFLKVKPIIKPLSDSENASVIFINNCETKNPRPTCFKKSVSLQERATQTFFKLHGQTTLMLSIVILISS